MTDTGNGKGKTIIQLDNGSNYEIVENIKTVDATIQDEFIKNETFIAFHFPDGFECRIKKSKISAFYENTESE